MATTSNARNVMLANDSPRTLPVTLPSTYNTSGDHSGTWNSLGQTVHRNDQVQLSTTGQLLNAGGGGLTTLDGVGGNYLGNWESVGRTAHRNDLLSLSSTGQFTDNGTNRGSITNLDYTNVGGTKPPNNATANFFSTSGSNPSGGSDGDAHWNSSTSTMWFKTGGVWRVGGTINANQITVGTLAAARIASNSITSDKINVSQLSGISQNIGTITAGSIQSSATIDISGFARFNGAIGGYSILANNNINSQGGVNAASGTSSLPAIRGQNHSGGGVSIQAVHNGSGTALECTAVFGTALSVNGPISISSQTISNLTAGAANFVSGSNVSGTVGSAQTAVDASNADNADFATNSAQLGSVAASSWCRQMATNSGTASASSNGFVFTSTVTGVRTRATGGRNFVVEEFSDENLKQDIQPEELGSEFIRGLEPITYTYDNITMHGFGARRTRGLLERMNKRKNNDCLARTLDDGVESSSAIGKIGPIVKTLQEILDRLDAQDEEIKRLQKGGTVFNAKAKRRI